MAVLKRAFGPTIEIVVLDRNGQVPQRYYPDLIFKQAYVGNSLVARVWRRLDIAKLYVRLLASMGSRRGAKCRALPRALRDNMREFETADLVVSAGGTYLVEHYHLELNLLQLQLASSSGAPTVMFTQSLGPFRDPVIRRWIRDLFPRMSMILLRDRRSQGNLAQAEVATANTRVIADAAFALADPETLGRPRRTSELLRVAISVRSWKFPGSKSPKDAERNYLHSIGEMVTHLVRSHGAQVTFVSSCQGVPEYSYDDSAVARTIAGRLPADVAASVAVDSGFHRPEDLRDVLGEFDLVVATRLHVAILALCAGTPVLPIAYEFKTRELFETMGLGEWLLDITSLDPRVSVATLERIVQSRDQIQADIGPKVMEQHQGAMSVAEELVRLVKRPRAA